MVNFKQLRRASFISAVFTTGVLAGAIGTAVGASVLGSSVFPDVPGGSYYDTAVGEMYSLGLITGFGDGKFRPDDPLTRGQAAVIMKRLRDEILGIDDSGSSNSSRIRSSSSSSSSSTSSGSVSSIPNNAFGLFRFTTSTYSFDEDVDVATVTVVRTGSKKGIVGVEYALKAGTATADSDYEILSGVLNFQEDETSKNIEITIKDDTDDENDETFTVELSNPTGGAAIIDPKIATVTIKDDDGVLSGGSGGGTVGPEQGTFNWSATEFGALESSSSVLLTVERQGGSKGSATVKYALTNGTADANYYIKKDGTLTFGDGITSQTITVELIDNSNVGGNKTVNLALNTPTGGAVLGTAKTSLLTIYDDEAPTTFGSGSLRFTDNTYEGAEGEQAVISVRRIKGTKGTVTVNYDASTGTATKGSDYDAAVGTLTFRPGEAVKSFLVNIKSDSDSDGGEKVNLNLSAPTGGATLDSPASATLEIY